MRKLLIVTVILLVFPFSLMAAPLDGERPGRFKEKIVTMRNWELMDVFDLSEKRAQEVFSILKKYDKERERLIMERRELMRALRREVSDPAAPEDRLKELINRYHELNMRIAELPKRELEGLSRVFSTRELARYILFSERFSRDLKATVYRKLDDRRRRGRDPFMR
jgi:Spy/CpxP family protein refolding chaperone